MSSPTSRASTTPADVSENLAISARTKSTTVTPSRPRQHRSQTNPLSEITTADQSASIAVDTTDPEVSGIASWKDYFAAGAVAGNSLDVLKDQTEVVSAALRAGGVAPADLCSTDKAQYAAAQELLSTFKPKVIDWDGGIERMVKGSSKARMAWG